MKRKFIWQNEKMLPTGFKEVVEKLAPRGINCEVHIINNNGRSLSKKVSHSQCPLIGDINHGGILEIVYLTRTALVGFPIFLVCREVDESHLGLTSYAIWYTILYNILYFLYYAEVYENNIATRDPGSLGPTGMPDSHDARRLVSSIAKNKAKLAIDLYSLKDERIGEPVTFLDGIPGMFFYDKLQNIKRIQNENQCAKMLAIHRSRMEKCGGQMTLSTLQYSIICLLSYITKRDIIRIADDLKIDRHVIDSAGRKHRYFTHGESVRIKDSLSNLIKEGKIKPRKKKCKAEFF